MIRVMILWMMLAAMGAAEGQTQSILVEDFSYDGAVPTKWRILQRSTQTSQPLPAQVQRDNDYAEVVTIDGEKVLRVFTRDETEQIARVNGEEGLDWDIRTHPILSWQWRAEVLPEGARETERARNDTGAALYVSFDCNDWLGRPCTIKYTYSSTLAVGTTARYSRLRVLVVSSAVEGLGRWITIERNVREDFQRLFGNEVPDKPAFLMVWGDTDTTHGVSDVYFDTITIAAEN